MLDKYLQPAHPSAAEPETPVHTVAKNANETLADLQRRTYLTQLRNLPPTQDAQFTPAMLLPEKKKPWWE